MVGKSDWQGGGRMTVTIREQLSRARAVLESLDEDEWRTSADIGNHLGMDPKTVRRYIGRLRSEGHLIESQKGHGYRLSEPAPLEPLRFTDEELTTLFLSLARSEQDFPHQLVRSLRERLLRALSSSRRSSAESLVTTAYTTEEAALNLDHLKTISKAFEKQKLLRVRYQGLKDSEPRFRLVQPRRFVYNSGSWYLDVWDAEIEKERSFLLDRMSDVLCLPESFRAPDLPDSAPTHAWDFGDEDMTVKMRVTPRLANWLREKPAHPSQKIVEGTKNPTIHFEVSSPQKFIDWLAGLRGFELLEPEELVGALKERGALLAEDAGTLGVPWEV